MNEKTRVTTRTAGSTHHLPGLALFVAILICISVPVPLHAQEPVHQANGDGEFHSRGNYFPATYKLYGIDGRISHIQIFVSQSNLGPFLVEIDSYHGREGEDPDMAVGHREPCNAGENCECRLQLQDANSMIVNCDSAWDALINNIKEL